MDIFGLTIIAPLVEANETTDTALNSHTSNLDIHLTEAEIDAKVDAVSLQDVFGTDPKITIPVATPLVLKGPVDQSNKVLSVVDNAIEAPVLSIYGDGTINTAMTVFQAQDLITQKYVNDKFTDEFGHTYFLDNGTATNTVSVDAWVKAAGVRPSLPLNVGFTAGYNKLTYSGQLDVRVFKVDVSFSVESSTAGQLTEYCLYLNNSTEVTASRIQLEMPSSGVVYTGSINTFVQLESGDYISLMVRTRTSAGVNLTVSHLHLVAFSTNFPISLF